MTNPSDLVALAASLQVTLEESAATRLLAYLDAMLVENQSLNLTGVRDREQAVVLHALDSLAPGHAELGLGLQTCLDLGTGNGFPGVALACLFPEARVTLMDRTLKKLRAIERALTAAEIDRERVVTLHMDAVAAAAHGHRGAFDLVSSRAVGEARAVAQLARPLVKRGGHLVCWLSEEQWQSSEDPSGFEAPRTVTYDLPEPARRRRVLANYRRLPRGASRRSAT